MPGHESTSSRVSAKHQLTCLKWYSKYRNTLHAKVSSGNTGNTWLLILPCLILWMIAQSIVFFRHSAENKADLCRHRITHILNAAHSKRGGQPEIYEGMTITYMGIEAHDSCGFDMSVNFHSAAAFIHGALSRGGRQAGGRGRLKAVQSQLYAVSV